MMILLWIGRSVPGLGYPIQEGIASFYADDFHGKRTANGEIYNMHTLTAAHRTLPLGTLVEVTNLANQKKVIVRINDRGPFKDDRIIDLSLLAAKKLNIVTPGTAKVSLRPLSAEWLMSTISPEDSPGETKPTSKASAKSTVPAAKTAAAKSAPPSSPATPAPQPAITGSTGPGGLPDSSAQVYTIQIGAFQNPSAAYEFYQSTQLLLKNVYINGPSGAYKLFKIQTGSFFAYEEAQAYLKIINNFGYQEAFIATLGQN